MALDSLALSLFSQSGTDVTSSLLGALYGTVAAAGTGTGGNPILALKVAELGETKGVAAVSAQPATARDLAGFRAGLATAKTPAALLANPAALKVLLTANGLGDQVQFAALASKALLSDTSQAGSLASKLVNPQWLAVAKTYDFANKGLSVLQAAAATSAVVSGYAEVQWRTSLDAGTPGLSNALDFRSRASGITSVDQILGDATLRAVVTTALGIPQQIAFQPLEAQEKAVSSRLDLSNLQSPAFVEQFAKRYLVAVQAAGGSGGTAGVTSLFA